MEVAGHRVVVDFLQCLLVHLPRDSGALQPFRIRAPGERLDAFGVDPGVVIDEWAAACSLRVDRAGPQHRAIGAGRTGDGAEIVIAEREALRESVVKRDVLPQKISHRHVGLVERPRIHAPGGDGPVLGIPAVVEILNELGRAGMSVEMEWQDRLIRALHARLKPDRLAVGEAHGEAVVVAADTAQVAEIMIEGAVLQHEDHDMLDIIERAGSAEGRQRGGARQAVAQEGARGRCRTHGFEKLTTVHSEGPCPCRRRMAVMAAAYCNEAARHRYPSALVRSRATPSPYS